MGEAQASEARRAWMAVLAQAPAARLAAHMKDADGRAGVEASATAAGGATLSPAFTWLRRPEAGAVMVRGRVSATGAPFNLGEMTVTRCTLQLADGTVGFAMVPGRDGQHAERAALCDALMQTEAASMVEATVLAPLRAAADAERARDVAEAERTRVDFETLVRGED